MLDRMIRMKSWGSPDQTSMKRWKARSIQPPKKPWTAAAAMPMTEAAAVRNQPEQDG